jgi:hypothetical protein
LFAAMCVLFSAMSDWYDIYDSFGNLIYGCSYAVVMAKGRVNFVIFVVLWCR